MPVKIQYDNKLPFSGQPTPFVGQSKESIYYGERWGGQQNIVLAGQLTGCDFSDLTNAQYNLIQGFSKNFQQLRITTYENYNNEEIGEFYEYLLNNFEDGKINPYDLTGEYLYSGGDFYHSTGGIGGFYNLILSGSSDLTGANNIYASNIVGFTNQVYNNVIVDSISFSENKYVKILPYTINLSCYPSDYFSQVANILEPKDSWEYVETENGVLEMTHTISARGVNSTGGSSNAYQNAVNFVNSRTGFSNFVNPEFIQNYRSSGILTSQKSVPNRLEGSYSLTETYRLDQAQPCDYGVLRYDVTVSQPQNGYKTASIQGVLQGGFNDDFELTKNRFNSFDVYSNLIYSINSGINFNHIPVNKQVSEDSQNRTISFSYNYDDNPVPQTSLDYTLQVNSGVNEIQIDVNGSIVGRGELKNRWELVSGFYSEVFSPYILANSGYLGYVGENLTGNLNKNTLSESVSFDKFNGIISFSYSYSDKSAPLDGVIENIDYGLSFTPAIRRIISKPLVIQNGTTGVSNYETLDLNYISRGHLGVNGSAYGVRSSNLDISISGVKNILGNIAQEEIYSKGYDSVYLDSYSLTTTKDNLINFNLLWSYESPDALGNTGNYTNIINL